MIKVIKHDTPSAMMAEKPMRVSFKSLFMVVLI